MSTVFQQGGNYLIDLSLFFKTYMEFSKLSFDEIQLLELPINRANSSWCPYKKSLWETGSFSPDRTVLVISWRNSTGKETSVSDLPFSPCINRPGEQMPLSQCREQNSSSRKSSLGSARTPLKINILSETLHPALLCSCKQEQQSLISYANDTWHLKSSDTEAINKKPSTTRLLCLLSAYN